MPKTKVRDTLTQQVLEIEHPEGASDEEILRLAEAQAIRSLKPRGLVEPGEPGGKGVARLTEKAGLPPWTGTAGNIALEALLTGGGSAGGAKLAAKLGGRTVLPALGRLLGVGTGTLATTEGDFGEAGKGAAGALPVELLMGGAGGVMARRSRTLTARANQEALAAAKAAETRPTRTLHRKQETLPPLTKIPQAIYDEYGRPVVDLRVPRGDTIETLKWPERRPPYRQPWPERWGTAGQVAGQAGRVAADVAAAQAPEYPLIGGYYAAAPLLGVLHKFLGLPVPEGYRSRGINP